MEPRRIAVLGATGSVGRAALEVIDQLGKGWEIWGITGNRQTEKLLELARQYSPQQVVLAGDGFSESSGPATDRRSPWIQSVGPEALVKLAEAPEVDTVVAAIVGRAGLESTLAAIASGKRVALANKETLVMAGPLVQRMLTQSNAELLPVDSEHSAIFQCLNAGPARFAQRLILTASGGPLRGWTWEQMRQATPAQALEHPTWRMGPKITVDSATMMNKALEIIEARWLFDVPADRIEVLVHPQSIIHSMVEFADGSLVAQMSPPDMRLPIQYALTYPHRAPCPAPRLDRQLAWDLHLEPVDRERFPAIDMGFEVAEAGGSAGAVMNAANEQAVELFLSGKLRLTDIVAACRAALDHHHFDANPSLESLLALDRWARAEVLQWTCSARLSS